MTAALVRKTWGRLSRRWTWNEPGVQFTRWAHPVPLARASRGITFARTSTFQDQLPLLLRLVAALSKLDFRVVVTLGPALSSEDLPSFDNVTVLKSAPHSEILREAAALITHCGHGTTIKGLAAGVPLLCIPMGRDQADNVARVVHAGAAIRASTNSSERSLWTSVERLLSEPSFKHIAQTLTTRDSHGGWVCRPNRID